MDDKQLDQLLDDAHATYRAAPAPEIEALWQRIDTNVFAAPVPVRRSTEWRIAWRLAAASLVLGVLAGRWTAGVGGTDLAQTAIADAGTALPVSQPYQQATEQLLGQTAVLLTALSTDRTSEALASHVSAQATQLLGTTRFLLDSPAGSDPRMHTLLLDLEMTLAQVARLQPARNGTELTLINEAVVERDIVPRIRSAVVDLNGGGY